MKLPRRKGSLSCCLRLLHSGLREPSSLMVSLGCVERAAVFRRRTCVSNAKRVFTRRAGAAACARQRARTTRRATAATPQYERDTASARAEAADDESWARHTSTGASSTRVPGKRADGRCHLTSLCFSIVPTSPSASYDMARETVTSAALAGVERATSRAEVPYGTHGLSQENFAAAR